MDGIKQVLQGVLGEYETDSLLEQVYVPKEPLLSTNIGTETNKSGSDKEALNSTQIALCLALGLFSKLLKIVPDAKLYVDEQKQQNRKIVFDHGALRTIAYPDDWHIHMPAGKQAFSRILEPLGYELAGIYPLDRIKMCGFVYRHKRLADSLPQYFVSEIYPESFSEVFQYTLQQVVADTVDPLSEASKLALKTLSQGQPLTLPHSQELLENLIHCFDRHHSMPSWQQYKALLDESAEMAWISTEGNAFNHATDRVANLDDVVREQNKLGRKMKPAIEEGINANIRQTAYKAAPVLRPFSEQNGPEEREVPGSFFEFIERGEIERENGERVLDLRFDSKNAQGIFKMTQK